MQQAIERLELAVVRQAIRVRVKTPLGAASADAIAPFPRAEEARERIEAIRQMRGLVERDHAPPVIGGTDVRPAIELGEKGVVLDGQQLRAIAETMQASTLLRRFLIARETEAPLLYGIGASLEDLGRTADHVSRSFAPDGQLADDASPDLGPLRKTLRSLHGKMEEKLRELMGADRFKAILQESYFTVRGDRYVLPIKASFQGQVQGIVHDASGSGQTVFIEPQEVVEIGNRLKIAASKVLEEEQRILSELTRLVVRDAAAIRVATEVIAKIDLIAGSARFAFDLDCHPVVPTDVPGFNLVAARHPQLVLQNLADTRLSVVANDIGLSREQRVLILTGPNTGGKTVAMKTVGLLALMVRAGLHIPCSPHSQIGWFDRIHVAIGDDQSIASQLSTFAAHVRTIGAIVHAAAPGGLVLIDEIAADTDPTQGQALAQALLEALADRGAHTIVTTHFEGLKAVPFADRRFRNAGVGFDPERLRPTYRVTLDLPQGSSGFDIAQSLGLEKKIVDRARDLIGEGSRAIDQFMKSLQSKQAELESTVAELEKERAALVRREAELENARLALVREREQLGARARDELFNDIQERRAEVRAIVANLQRLASNDAVREAMRQATEAATRIAQIQAEEQARLAEKMREGQERRLEAVNVGDWVHVPRLGKDGLIVAIDGRESVVKIGNMRARVATDSLEAARGGEPKGAARREIEALMKRAETNRPAGREPAQELDLRGLDVEEALARLEAFLDHHYGGQNVRVCIIHGHGTGALRAATRANLKQSGYVRDFRPGEEGEGGDGVTIVELA